MSRSASGSRRPGTALKTGVEFRLGADGSLKQNFKLQPSRPITGLVVDAAGKPVAKGRGVRRHPDRADSGCPTTGTTRTFTDAAGRSSSPIPASRGLVVAKTDAGVALASSRPTAPTPAR